MLTQLNIDSRKEWLEAANTVGAALLIDKEIGWTSFDVVAKLRNILRISKIGHAGTLDPLATGLLIVCCGKATKTIESYQDQTKEYETVVRLGATTETYDSERPEQNVQDISHLGIDAIREAVLSFVGEIDQLPPMFSARKVGGKRLYELARKGKEVERSTRRVKIHSIEILSMELPLIRLRVRCSKGTYIRSLAHDIGSKLGCGAYMYSLRRSMIGDYHVDQALRVPELMNLFAVVKTASTETATTETAGTETITLETTTVLAETTSATSEETAAEGSNG